ncbi:MAG TPA: diguanylate cyclase [Xanthobacteraceae bacterium]|nr:diguanylate cyclase [Xanthobacteraceae bacterium]
MAAPALKKGRGTVASSANGGSDSAGLVFSEQGDYREVRSRNGLRGLYGHPGMPAMVSIILMDIDHFKRLNDRHGHDAGDLCLKRLPSILVAELGAASEGAVRYGGEEFLVVLPEMQLADAMRIAERIRRSVEKATIPNGGPGLYGVVTASFGVASAFVGELTAAELISVADTALYPAKRKGRNQVWPPLAAPSDASNFEQISFRGRA